MSELTPPHLCICSFLLYACYANTLKDDSVPLRSHDTSGHYSFEVNSIQHVLTLRELLKELEEGNPSDEWLEVDTEAAFSENTPRIMLEGDP